MTFLVPTLMIAMYASVFLILMKVDDSLQTCKVLDKSKIFVKQFQNQKNLQFNYINGDFNQYKKELINSKEEILLYIPSDYEETGHIDILSSSKAKQSDVIEIENQMATILHIKRLLASGIDPKILNQLNPTVKINAKEISDEGEKDSNIGAAATIGIISSFLIYLSLFIYGAQVMRGVIEEKTNRIIEVIVSSVKPFQLMMGKILGIGAVGLTQFLLWIFLSTTLMGVASSILLDKGNIRDEITQKTLSNSQLNNASLPSHNGIGEIMTTIDSLNFPYIIGCFLFYFIGGYLIYSALFAAIGSAVDNETETQQFMFPITLPLIFTFLLGSNVIVNNPDSSMAFWLSIIPFTSPIAMMIRIPFGVPIWQLLLSMTLLIAGFVFTTWVASRIYRVGILMYGKKINYKELIKWFSYKE
jgi:ABC-2 type transport system permease protein